MRLYLAKIKRVKIVSIKNFEESNQRKKKFLQSVYATTLYFH